MVTMAARTARARARSPSSDASAAGIGLLPRPGDGARKPIGERGAGPPPEQALALCGIRDPGLGVPDAGLHRAPLTRHLRAGVHEHRVNHVADGALHTGADVEDL